MEESNNESDDSDASKAESSSDDEHQWKKAVKEEYKKVQQEKKQKERKEKMLQKNSNNNQIKEPKFYEIKEGASVYSNNKKSTDTIIRNEKLKKLPLLNRLEQTSDSKKYGDSTLVFRNDSFGNKQMTFLSRKVKIIK
jgi:hypothetical protein